MSEADLAILLGRLGGRPIGIPAARAVVRRWQALGLVEARAILQGEPRFISPTTRGAVELGMARFSLDGRAEPVRPVAWSQIPHVVECGRVRLALEVEFGDRLAHWSSDRVEKALSARSELKTKPHPPDAVVTLTDGLVLAIEVELNPKSPKDLDAIVKELMIRERWSAVRYYATEEAGRAVLASIERIRSGGRGTAPSTNALAGVLSGGQRGPNPIEVFPLPGGELALFGATGA